MINDTTKKLIDMLEVRYSAPAYAFFREVRNQTGFSHGRIRSADGIALSLYPSRGLHLHGFEVKSSRSDWLHELKDPSKADGFYEHCHFWWLVVSDINIVKLGELPPSWGLLVPHGKNLQCAKQPTLLEPKAVDMVFLAGLLRSVQSYYSDSVKREDVERLATERADAQMKYRGGMTQQYYDEMTKLGNNAREFEKITGVDIGKWTPPERVVEQALLYKAVRDGQYNLKDFVKHLDYAKRTISTVLEDIVDAQKGLGQVATSEVKND